MTDGQFIFNLFFNKLEIPIFLQSCIICFKAIKFAYYVKVTNEIIFLSATLLCICHICSSWWLPWKNCVINFQEFSCFLSKQFYSVSLFCVTLWRISQYYITRASWGIKLYSIQYFKFLDFFLARLSQAIFNCLKKSGVAAQKC